MRRKKLFSLLCAAAFALSAFGGVSVSAEPGGETALSTETEGTLSAPTNVREENGFIVWDEVPNAYGYTVRTFNGTEEIQKTYYENNVEWQRFIHEQTYNSIYDLDFGNYSFEVCAFDESRKNSAWSDSVSVSYVPTFDAAINPNLQELNNGIIAWNSVDGAARYNIKVSKEDGTTYSKFSSAGCSFWWWGWVHETGNYSIKIQAMDADYNVSAWSESIAVAYTAPSNTAPQNVRFDESGDYVLWDAVEGAKQYHVSVMNFINGMGTNQIAYVDASQCQSEWKFLVSPFADSKHNVWIGVPNEIGSWNSSDPIEANFTPAIDETLIIPTELKLENGNIEWDVVEGAAAHWMRISAYGNFFGSNGELGIKTNSLFDSNQFPAGTYDVETYAVRQNGNYNGRKHSLTINTIPDESVWIPKLYYKFDVLEWDWDRLRHEKTNHFWLRFSQNGTVIQLKQLQWNSFYGLSDLPDGEYTVEICATESFKTGKWSDPLLLVKHGEGLFDKENETTTEIEPTPDSEKIPESDRITSITINPAFNMKNKNDMNVELDLTKIKIKAKEIYDEEGLKRAEEALGEEIIGNKHYNLLDLTLLYNDQDFSNGYEGLVQVIIPIPTGHRDKTFSCYRLIEVDGKTTKEVIPGEQTEDSYIIYLEHFSEYALVADGGETPAKQGFYSDGLNILNAGVGTIVTQKTPVKNGKYDIRFIQKANGASLSGKSKATFTLTANGVTKKVSTDKYYTGLTFDDGTKAAAASGQVFLCYTVKDVPEGVTVEATAVTLE